MMRVTPAAVPRRTSVLAAKAGTVLALLYVFPVVAQAVGDDDLRRHLKQVGPMAAGLSVQATRADSKTCRSDRGKGSRCSRLGGGPRDGGSPASVGLGAEGFNPADGCSGTA